MTELSFSISHAGNLAIVALAQGAAVGIDVEQVGRKIDLEALARRVMSPTELAEFATMPPDRKPAAFFQVWTAKEAYLKALGVGLVSELGASSFPLVSALEPTLVRPAGPADITWMLQGLPMPPGYCANVVWSDPARPIDFVPLPPPE